VRIQTSQVRGVLLCCVTLGACLVGTRPAVAEVTLMEKDGWTFFTDGRVNVFGSVGFGDDFPNPTPNTNVDAMGNPGPPHTSVIGFGQPFTAGFDSFQGNANGKYLATRFRSGFLGSILGFVQVTEDPVACPHHAGRLTIDEVPIGITVAAEDGVDDRALIALIVRGGGRVVYRPTPVARAVVRMGRRSPARLHHEGGRAEPRAAGPLGHRWDG